MTTYRKKNQYWGGRYYCIRYIKTSQSSVISDFRLMPFKVTQLPRDIVHKQVTIPGKRLKTQTCLRQTSNNNVASTLSTSTAVWWPWEWPFKVIPANACWLHVKLVWILSHVERGFNYFAQKFSRKRTDYFLLPANAAWQCHQSRLSVCLSVCLYWFAVAATWSFI